MPSRLLQSLMLAQKEVGPSDGEDTPYLVGYISTESLWLVKGYA